jgi:hypothetical protein
MLQDRRGSDPRFGAIIAQLALARKALPNNNVLELTRLSRVEIEAGFVFVAALYKVCLAQLPSSSAPTARSRHAEDAI